MEGRHPLNSICELGKQKSMPPSKNARAFDYYTREIPPPKGREKGGGYVPRGTHFYANSSKLRIAKQGDRGGGEEGERERVDDEERAQRDTGMDGWIGRVLLTRVGAFSVAR